MESSTKTGGRGRLQKQGQGGFKAKKTRIMVLIILAAVYVAGCVFFSSHFYLGGTVFGVSMRGKTVEALKEQVREKVGDYRMTVDTRDGQETMTAEQIGLEYDDQGEIDELLKQQNALLWVAMFATAQDDRAIAMTLDETEFSDTVAGLSCMQEENMTAPTDAYMEYTGEKFVICDETYGNRLEFDTVSAALREAILAGETSVSLDDLDCYVSPQIYADMEELVQECKEVNQIIDVEITYDFSDRTIVADKSLIAGWITFGDDFTYDLDQEAVEDFVYDMAYETDTFGLTRTFTTHVGKEITLKGGDYGWCIHQSKTTEQLIGLVKAGKSATVEPVYRYSAMCRETDDIGGNYVEVSISDQMMWVYKDGECIVSTPVVTGNVSLGYDTPSGGVWAVDARISPYTLTGQDYNSDVTYWLPFNGDVGIHDATWRDEFGGDIYKKNGSHGCVNTPLAAMKTVYENVKIGYPVVVY